MSTHAFRPWSELANIHSDVEAEALIEGKASGST